MSDPLSPVAERLALGQFDAAVALATPLLTAPYPEDCDPEEHGGAVFAAAILVGVSENVSAFAVLDRLGLGVSPALRRSLLTALAQVRLLEAAVQGRLVARLLLALGGEASRTLEERGAQVGHELEHLIFARIAERLGEVYRVAGDLGGENKVATARAKHAQRAFRDQPHELAVALVTLADVLSRQGRRADAARFYAVVLRDHAALADVYEHEPIDRESRLALMALAAACHQYPKLLDGSPEYPCQALHARIQAIFDRAAREP